MAPSEHVTGRILPPLRRCARWRREDETVRRVAAEHLGTVSQGTLESDLTPAPYLPAQEREQRGQKPARDAHWPCLLRPRACQSQLPPLLAQPVAAAWLCPCARTTITPRPWFASRVRP